MFAISIKAAIWKRKYQQNFRTCSDLIKVTLQMNNLQLAINIFCIPAKLKPPYGIWGPHTCDCCLLGCETVYNDRI
jgi:hypothetical protein